MKTTPINEAHISLGAKMVEFAGYSMPLEYTGVTREHLAVRENAGLFDVSHMGEFLFEGEGALGLLQYTTTNDVSVLVPGKAQYTCIPNTNGGIVDDVIIYMLAEKKYLVVVNAANIDKDWQWFNSHNKVKAQITNVSDSWALFALQGPKSVDILGKLTNVNIGGLKPFNLTIGIVADINGIVISATGYTGSGGFELFCPTANAAILWNALVKAGVGLGLQPAGLAARDTLRLEKGYCLYGNDINDQTTPLEAGLGWITKLNKGVDCVSADILKEQKAKGVQKKLAGLVTLERGIPRKGYQVYNAVNNFIGEVTSGTQSPLLKQGIGMAYLKIEEAQPGNELFIEIRNRKIRCKVVKFPFI